jgi:peptide deformylase
MNLKILNDRDPILRKPCLKVDNIKEHIPFATSMYFTMKAKKALGLAANQVGKSLRIITLSLPDFEGAMFNPIILESIEEVFEFREGCLSIPGVGINTKNRSKSIRVQWQDKSGTYNEKEFNDISAVAIQHEIDHLNGILFIDYLDNKDGTKT